MPHRSSGPKPEGLRFKSYPRNQVLSVTYNQTRATLLLRFLFMSSVLERLESALRRQRSVKLRTTDFRPLTGHSSLLSRSSARARGRVKTFLPANRGARLIQALHHGRIKDSSHCALTVTPGVSHSLAPKQPFPTLGVASVASGSI